MAETADVESTTWWGDFDLDEQQTGRWEVGPSIIWIARGRHEWRVAHVEAREPLSEATRVNLDFVYDEVEADLEGAGATITRFGFRQTGRRIRLMPALADRPLIVRPETLLYISKGETVVLYVSTPLWVQIEAGEPPQLLQEVPSHRPSDTWFGASTREGELCYATRTAGRLKLEDLPVRLNRAVTPVRIVNRAKDPLRIERLRLPALNLALYQAKDGLLWTQAVILEREQGGEMAEMKLGETPPKEAPDGALLRGPRRATQGNVIVRAFSSLFHRVTVA